MKALTLYQPCATLVAIGAKQIETRSWATSYRGPLAIHAGKKFPVPAKNLVYANKDFRSALIVNGELIDIPLGSILAICQLLDCRLIVEGNIPAGPEWSFGDYRIGRYMWILGDVEKVNPPIRARGFQRLWEWEGNHG